MKIARFRTLAFRLTIWYVVILGLIVALCGAFLYQGFKKGLLADLDKQLRDIAEHVSEHWEPRGVTWPEAIAETEAEFRALRPFIQAVKLAPGGNGRPEIVHRSPLVPADTFLFPPELYAKAESADWDHLVYGTAGWTSLSTSPLRVVLLPVRGENLIQVGVSLDHVNRELARLTLIMILAGLLLVAFASIGGSLIIRRALSPVQSVVYTARRITADDLTLRIDAKNRKDEIGELVATFNDMIARLDKSVQKIRQFSGDVSHELRTPLTIIRGEIEVILRKERSGEEYRTTLESALEESHHMEKIIDDLLFLSRMETAAKLNFNQDVALDEVLSRVLDSRGAAARQKGLAFTIGHALPLRVRGDRTLLERLVTNLVDNAIRYTPAGGRIEMALAKEDAASVLEVRDTGIGIPAESIPFIFDRFYVVDPSRSKEIGGSGLGLSIVKSVADLHGASVEVRSRVHEGTIFAVRFPARE